MPLPLLGAGLFAAGRAALPHVAKALAPRITAGAGSGLRGVAGKDIGLDALRLGGYAGGIGLGLEGAAGVGNYLGTAFGPQPTGQLGSRVYQRQLDDATRGLGGGGFNFNQPGVGNISSGQFQNARGQTDLNFADMDISQQIDQFGQFRRAIPAPEMISKQNVQDYYSQILGDFGGGTTFDQSRINQLAGQDSATFDTLGLADWIPGVDDSTARGQQQARFETQKAMDAREAQRARDVASFAGQEGILYADQQAALSNQRADAADAAHRLANQLGGRGTFSSGAGVKDMAALEAVGQRDIANLRGQTAAQIAAVGQQRGAVDRAGIAEIGAIGQREGELANMLANQGLLADRDFMVSAAGLKEQARQANLSAALDATTINQNALGQGFAGMTGLLSQFNQSQGLGLEHSGMALGALGDFNANQRAIEQARLSQRGQNLDFQLGQEGNLLAALQGNQSTQLGQRGQNLDAAVSGAQLGQQQQELDQPYLDTINSGTISNIIGQAMQSGQNAGQVADTLQKMMQSAGSPSQRAAIAQALAQLRTNPQATNASQFTGGAGF
jgi:hypothetical protein